MKFRNQFLKYQLNCNDESGGDDGGGGGGEDQAAIIADLQTQMTALKSKNDELLGETKNAKNAKREAEALAKTSAEEALQKAGDFESLYKSSQSENEKLKTDYDGLKLGISAEKQNSAAMKLASELAEGTNVELLSSFISQRIRHTDEGIKVTDTSGNLTVSTMDDLKKEFQGNERYSSLLKGNQSSGGGATGSNNGSGASKERSLAEIEAMNPQDRAKFFRDKGTVLN